MFSQCVTPEQYFKLVFGSGLVDINRDDSFSISCELSKKIQSVKNSVKNSMFYALLTHSLQLSNYQISCITSEKLSLRKEFGKELQKFEEEIRYPCDEREDFMIRHGVGGKYAYESFFNDLGKPYFYVVRNKKNKEVTKIVKGKQETFLQRKGEIAAVACCILRKVKSTNGNLIKAWYICDLKVGKKYLGEHLPILIMRRGAWRLLQCQRGFGVCKNQLDGKTAKSANIMMQHGPFPGLRKVPFNIYNFSQQQIQEMERNFGTEQFRRIEQTLRKNKYIKGGRFTFTSNKGIKEYYRVSKTGEARLEKLLHAVPADVDRDKITAKEGYKHMFFALKGTSLDSALEEAGKSKPVQSGMLLSFRMDPNFKITSAEI